MTDNRKIPTLGRLIACEGKTVRHFIETIRTDIIRVHEGDSYFGSSDVEDYLDRIIDYINVRYPDGWCLAEIHVKEVSA